MISGFITNLSKYNEGMLKGAWITFPISDKELEEALEQIGVVEEYEEFFFTDWETDVPVLSSELGEYPSISMVNDLAEKIDKDEEQAACIIEAFGLSDFMESDPDDYTLWYCDRNDDEELGAILAETFLDISQDIKPYFDYEKYGRDFRFSTNGGWCSSGYIERHI